MYFPKHRNTCKASLQYNSEDMGTINYVVEGVLSGSVIFNHHLYPFYQTQFRWHYK